jgi:hypothetical protein
MANKIPDTMVDWSKLMVAKLNQRDDHLHTLWHEESEGRRLDLIELNLRKILLDIMKLHYHSRRGVSATRLDSAIKKHRNWIHSRMIERQRSESKFYQMCDFMTLADDEAAKAIVELNNSIAKLNW